MSRDPLPDDEAGPQEGPPQGSDGRLRTTRPGLLVACAVVGLVLGWLVRPVAVWADATAPRVTWLPVLALYLVALILGAAARATYRALHQRRQPLPAHQAVNRLVLAKSSAITGALVAGGYLGYALTWSGVDAELSGERVLRSVVAAGGAGLVTAAALLLERACRVRDADPQP